MEVISSWADARADALRQAPRMINEAFAQRLSVAVCTVAYWRERSGSVPQLAMQEALDAALAQAPELAQSLVLAHTAERERGAVRQLPPLGSLPHAGTLTSPATGTCDEIVISVLPNGRPAWPDLSGLHA